LGIFELFCISDSSDYVVIRYWSLLAFSQNNSDNASENEPRIMNVMLCIPVRPGKSRVISINARNFAGWFNKIVPRWYFHIGHNLVIDSDLCLLHVQVLLLSQFWLNYILFVKLVIILFFSSQKNFHYKNASLGTR
jgi:Pheophorbide a oxygenase